jgi:hypothetical protein
VSPPFLFVLLRVEIHFKEPTTVIASEAKQSIAPQKRKDGLLRYARNDYETYFRDLAA